MALLHDILKWTESLPSWQRDAARRLFKNESQLSENDRKELYVSLKADHGIAAPGGEVAIPLSAGDLPASIKSGATVVLKAVHTLQNVNRIASDQIVPFGSTGITIIYGGNGSGKSGYSRVLKRACRARDQSEPVLPDATNPASAGNIPSAKFDIEDGGLNIELTWVRDITPPEQLSAISVFDSRCARSYLTAEQDVAYLPYGLDVVENLANKVLPDISSKLEEEIDGIDVTTTAFLHLVGETQVGELVKGLSAKTKEETITKIGTLSEEETRRLSDLEKALNEADPSTKAKELSLSVSRIKGFSQKLAKPLAWVSDEAVEKLRGLNEQKVASENAETDAAKVLESGEQLLPGTGAPIWKQLFEAAQKYSTEVAYPEIEFPNVDSSSVCPLCQETLSEVASSRLVRFNKYIRNDIAKKASDDRSKVGAAKEKIGSANLQIADDLAIIEELKQLDVSLPQLVDEFEASLDLRRKAMLNALKDHDWTGIPKLANDPRTAIRKTAAAQLRACRTYARAGDEDKKKELIKEHAELSARQSLSKVQSAFIDLLRRLKNRAELEKCRAGLKTRPISDKSKELASIAVTAELKKSLDNEFQQLGIGHIKTKLKEKNSKGKMLHQLLLDLPVANRIDEILSEGEQRAIALGSFLAELSLANHSCGIILDDPVSSLDHKRRSMVARRLVAEAGKRQVIVFTHEVVFLQQLRDECEKILLEPVISYLDWKGSNAGVVEKGLPWVHKSIDERFDALEKAQRHFEGLPWPAEPPRELGAQITREYSLLRATIERVVQDLLLNGTVQRFRDYIDVKRLTDVVGIAQQEVDELFRLNQRCHDVGEAHDPASAKDDPPPTPTELKKDINDLKALVQTVRDRRKAAKKK